MSRKDKIGIRSLLLPVILAIVFILVFSATTSPLYPNNYGVDSAFYRFAGSSVLRGKTLYKDIWDNKGPILFFIQAIGALKGTRNADLTLTFLLQILSLSVSLIFIMRAYQIAVPSEKKDLRFFLATVCALAILSITMEDGNLCEEWSLPFISCSLFLLIRYAARASEVPEHSAGDAFIHGICLAMIGFIRINNSVSICAGILFIGIYLAIKKQWKNLFLNFLYGLLGIAFVTIPILIYFQAKGAFSEMIYAVFLYNLKYVGAESHRAFTGMDLALRLPAAGSLLTAYPVRIDLLPACPYN